jgi:hypothetical protein
VTIVTPPAPAPVPTPPAPGGDAYDFLLQLIRWVEDLVSDGTLAAVEQGSFTEALRPIMNTVRRVLS